MEEEELLDRLISEPAETLNVELKTWIDPSSDDARDKIVKGCMAIRNRNGGYFIVGIDDKTRKVGSGAPKSPRDAWKEDDVQSIISRYASDLFSISLRFGRREDTDIPIIIIPSGIKTPVALKKQMGKYADGAVFFRTLRSGGVVSSSLIRYGDWPDIMQICFDNRDADIGVFIRRHLADVDIGNLGLQFARMQTPQPTLEASTRGFLDNGKDLFEAAKAKVTIGRVDPSIGSFEIAVVADPALKGKVADQDLRSTLRATNPNLSGTALWYDAPGSPLVKDGRWENLSTYEGINDHFDYMIVDPVGAFYQHSLLWADASAHWQGRKPGVSFEPSATIQDVAEHILAGITYTRAIGCNAQETNLGFAFRWTGLSARRLIDVTGMMPISPGQYQATDDSVYSFIRVHINTNMPAITLLAQEVVRPLFAAFKGYAMKSDQASRQISLRFSRR